MNDQLSREVSTRDRILETARALFFGKGYHATGIAEMIAKSVAVSLAALALCGSSWGNSEMPWVRDYDTALSKAKSSNQLIMVDFYADWCSWCKRLDSETFANREVAGLSSRFVPLRLNSEIEGQTLASQYKIKSLPSVILIDPRGSQWCLIKGYLPPETFATEVKKGLDAYERYPRALRLLQKDPSNCEGNAILAYVEAQRGNLAKSEAHLKVAQNAMERGRLLELARNAVGEAFFRNREIKKATEFFKLGMQTHLDDYERAYSIVSLGYCYQMAGDTASAKQVCERLVQCDSAPKEFVSMAKDLIQRASK